MSDGLDQGMAALASRTLPNLSAWLQALGRGGPAIVRRVRPGVGNFDASLLEKPGDVQALSDG